MATTKSSTTTEDPAPEEVTPASEVPASEPVSPDQTQAPEAAGDVGTTADKAETGPTAKDLRSAGYEISDSVGDDERAFAYSADTVITDPDNELAVQEVVVPTAPVNNTMTPAQFAAQVEQVGDESDSSITSAPSGGGQTEATTGDQTRS